ncbi:MAG TPA: ABC transporter ATP-binding protein, partial [Dongiaceae bacterium]
VLAVEDLAVGFEGLAPAVRGISFRIEPGEILAMVGESGSGKTMAARAILRLLPLGATMKARRLCLEGRELADLPEAAMRAIRGARVGMVFQEPMVSLNPAMTIGEQMLEGLLLHRRLGRAEARGQCLAMLRRIRMDDPERCFAAFPHEFSGGMRQRIMLASVMLLRPALLIADEPTTALDTLTQRDVLELMVDLCRENKTAILMISHNLALMAQYAARVAVMQNGEIVEQGAVQDILLRPTHDYTRRLLDALPQRAPIRPRDAGKPPLLEIRDLTVDHGGRRRLLRRSRAKRAVDGVSLSLHPGETVALVGGSGSGKTSLGRCLAGLIEPGAGSIAYRGQARDGGDAAHRRSFRLNCQMIFQDPYASLDPRMTVAAILREPLRHLPELSAAEKQQRLMATLADIGLDAAYLERLPHQLSGGQRQRVAIGRAIITRPALVIADEPVSSLDMTVQKQVLDLFRALQARYDFACLFISHDLGVVEFVADRIIVMQDGRFVETGSRDDIYDRPQHDYTRRLLAAAPLLGRAASGRFELQTRQIAAG